MLFQGQEWGPSSPFLFFSDHQDELGAAVRVGRAAFMRQFFSADVKDLHETLPDPNDASTFMQCKLRETDDPRHAQALALHRDLLRLRRDERAIREARRSTVDGAVLTERSFALRYFATDPRSPRAGESSADDRLVIVNLGSDASFDPASEPLLAPPAGMRWTTIWSSEAVEYGGIGARAFDPDEGWPLQGLSTLLLAPRAR
jgi:maltooligosyltrehalose trehalohydrolase